MNLCMKVPLYHPKMLFFLFFLGQFYHTLEKHEDIDDENALYAKPVKKGKVHVRLYIVFIYIYLQCVQFNKILRKKCCTSYKMWFINFPILKYIESYNKMALTLTEN